jgi:hypothetical protein
VLSAPTSSAGTHVRSVGIPPKCPSAHCCAATQGHKFPLPLANCHTARPGANTLPFPSCYSKTGDTNPVKLRIQISFIFFFLLFFRLGDCSYSRARAEPAFGAPRSRTRTTHCTQPPALCAPCRRAKWGPRSPPHNTEGLLPLFLCFLFSRGAVRPCQLVASSLVWLQRRCELILSCWPAASSSSRGWQGIQAILYCIALFFFYRAAILHMAMLYVVVPRWGPLPRARRWY